VCPSDSGERVRAINRRELFRERKLHLEMFARAVEVLGPRGVVNLAALMGNYAMTAVILDAVGQQLRPAQQPLLPP
jgi:hypothetical protein